MSRDSYADVVERLFQEFEWAIPLPVIARIAHDCSHEGSGSPPADESDLLERARSLLLAMTPPRPEH